MEKRDGSENISPYLSGNESIERITLEFKLERISTEYKINSSKGLKDNIRSLQPLKADLKSILNFIESLEDRDKFIQENC